MNQKHRIAFLGTPEFALPSLTALVKAGMEPAVVITRPDQPVGRHQELLPSAVKKEALKLKLPLVQPATSAELFTALNEHHVTIAIVVAYGQIISSKALAVPPDGFLNIHPSLLPRYRGAAPIQTALLHGDKKTGVTIIKLVTELDAGPIVSQIEVNIHSTDNAETLSGRLAVDAAKLLVDTLPRYLNGELKPIPQNEDLVTMTKPLLREDGKIDWSKSAHELDCQFRAFYPWPGVFTQYEGKRLKIENLSVLEGSFGPASPSLASLGGLNLKPGEVFQNASNIGVMTGAGAVVLDKVQLEGKKAILAKDFIKGNPKFVGSQLA